MPRQDQISKWLKLLGDEAKQKQALFEKYPENFRLDNPDQATIHQDCQSLESKSPIFEESELKNALELLLTYYCKTEQIAYKSGLHEILAPFFIMRFSNLKTVYGAFCAFIDKVIPCMFTLESSIDIIYNIFQKLMMYHEPLLFNTLQSSFPSHVQVVKKWLSTAMASCFNSANLLKFWEYMLEENKPSLSLFMALSLVYRKRESLMRKSKSKKNLNIEESDIEDFSDIIKEAVAYQNNTPKSFKKLIEKALLSGPQQGNGVKDLESSSILRISEKELVKPPANYIIIDRRPLKSYTKSHFPQSFNLSSELSITTGNLEELWSILSGFTTFCNSKNSKTCHFIFVSEPSDLKNANILCLDLVRRGIEKLSLISISFNNSHSADCSKCRFAKELNLLCQEKLDKKQVLDLLWENYNSDINHENIATNGFAKVRDSGIFKSGNKEFNSSSMYECLKLMWTNNLLEAESWFESKKQDDPRCALHFAEAGFLKALLLGDSESREAVTERLADTEKIASDHIKTLKKSSKLYNELKRGTEKNLGLEGKALSDENFTRAQIIEIVKSGQQLQLSLAVKAEATLFKSGSELLQRKLTTGSTNFRKAWKLYQKSKKIGEISLALAAKKLSSNEIIDLNKGLELDIKNMVLFGEGVIILGLSMAPSSMGKVARAALGIEVDQNKGIKSLYECINAKSGIRVPLSLMFLSFWLAIYIPDYIPGKRERLREAHELVRFSLHYYPQSPYFYWLESYLNQKQGNLERALKLLNRVISKSSKLGLNIIPGRLNFEKGWVLFLCHEWTSSVKCLNEACSAGNATAFTKLLMGVCNCMIGNLSDGQAILEELESNHINGSERWVSKRAARYLQRRRFQIFPFEIIYVTDSFGTLKAEWLESSLEYLGHISMEIEFIEELEEKAVWLLLKGTIFRLMGRLQQSVKALQEGISLENDIKDEIWVIPHLYYELGLVYARSRDWVSSTKCIRLARTYKKKYEFSNALNNKLKSAMDMTVQEENREFNK